MGDIFRQAARDGHYETRTSNSVELVFCFAIRAKMKLQDSFTQLDDADDRINLRGGRWPGRVSVSTRRRPIAKLLAVVLHLSALGQASAGHQQQQQQASSPAMSTQQYLDELQRSDTCGTVYTSKTHGYDVREYDIITKDNYQLRMHRLIHPEDWQRQHQVNGIPQPLDETLSTKKPYLLVHGLIGTSASFVLNVADHFRAPRQTFKARPHMVDVLKSKASVFQYEWEATAQRLQAEWEGDKRDRWSKQDKILAGLNEIVYDGDELNFGPEFRQAYRKFPLPTEALPFVSNSLAFTLSNMGYDVWLLNLRGNDYSRDFNGPMTASKDEYWDFKIETLAREDLMAAISFITNKKGNLKDPIGLVAYSYSGALVMNLLTKFPAYVERLQPIVLLAPTLMTGARDRGNKSKYALKIIDKLLSKNGPFPTFGRAVKPRRGRHHQLASLLSLSKLDEKLAWLVCSLPVASQLCRLMTTVIHGNSQRATTVRGLLNAGRATSLMQRDSDCGQTSKAILHQIFKNIDQENIMPDFMPFGAVAKRRQMQRASGQPALSDPAVQAASLRRSIMLIHAHSDEVATPSEVERIRSTALKTLTLLDYVIKSPEFGHTDFLFSRRNQYLVNAEVVRQVLLYDFLAYQSYANRPSQVPLGIRLD